jgi:hypothetical protein
MVGATIACRPATPPLRAVCEAKIARALRKGRGADRFACRAAFTLLLLRAWSNGRLGSTLADGLTRAAQILNRGRVCQSLMGSEV